MNMPTHTAPSQDREQTARPVWFFLCLLIFIGLGAGYALRSQIKRALMPAPLDANQPPACSEIGQTWTSPRSGSTLVCVPGGKFPMGAGDGVRNALDREKPLHEVVLHPFWIDRTEVTNEMFAKFVNASGYKTWAETKRSSSYVYSDDPSVVWDDRPGAKWDAPEGQGSSLIGREKHPVVHIHKDDAERYCRWAGGRLPSEAEWEKAARGTDERLFPWGNQDADGSRANIADKHFSEVAWADPAIDDGYRFTAPAGSFPQGASPYGALDMAGNVWEIVADWADWSYYAVSPAENPTGPVKGSEKVLPVIRGGSWYGNAWEARAFHRTMPDPNKSSVVVGFRCVIDDPATAVQP